MSDSEKRRKFLFLESAVDPNVRIRKADFRKNPLDQSGSRQKRPGRDNRALQNDTTGVGITSRFLPPVRAPGYLALENTTTLPQRRKTSSRWTLISFGLLVLAPVVLAAVYYAFIASPQYVTEFRFSVTDNTPSSTLASSASSIGGLSSLLGGAMTSSSQNYLVADFLMSREAVDELQKKINITSLYERPNIDWWSRFGRSEPIEKFVTYWQSMVNASYDQVTGLATAQVRAFTPQDSLLIANMLVGMAEHLVNDIATRPQRDAVKYAEAEVKRAEDRLKEIQSELTNYRNSENVIDPNNSVVMSNVTLAQSLRANITQMETQLSSLLQQKINRSSPNAQVLQSRITATKSQLADVEAQISKNTGGNQALSKIVSRYEQLMLDRSFAQSMVTSTMSTLEMARATAAAQHLYITPYVRPALPESSTYPNRIASVGWVAFIAFFIWLLGLLLYRSIQEHV